MINIFYKKKIKIYKKIIENNLTGFGSVIDSRGDGNCGYRSFIISTWMNNPKFAYNYFKKLLKDNFLKFFQEFDQTFEYQIKANKQIIGPEILDYILSILEQMKNTTSQDKLITLLNNEITFDYFMIMFIRYMLADYIKNHGTKDQREFITMTRMADSSSAEFDINYDPIASEIKKIVTWKDELDNLETTLLASMSSIQIQTIREHAQINSKTETNLEAPISHAYILHTDTPGHYKILLTK